MKRVLHPVMTWISLLTLLAFAGTACKKGSSGSYYDSLRQNIPEEYQAFVNPFGDGSTIGAAVNLTYDVVILYDKAGTRYAWYQNKKIQGVYSIKDSQGPLRATLLDNVGAALEWPSNGSTGYVFLFNQAGNLYTDFSYNRAAFHGGDTTMPANISVTYSNFISSISNFQGPFDSTGFEAAAQYVKPYTGGDIICHIFAKGGTQYARYDMITGKWGPVTQFTDWGGNNDLFPAVGAASLILLHDQLYDIFISKDGSQMGAWHADSNGHSVFEGPWTIN